MVAQGSSTCTFAAVTVMLAASSELPKLRASQIPPCGPIELMQALSLASSVEPEYWFTR